MNVALVVLAILFGGISGTVAFAFGLSTSAIILIYSTTGFATAVGIVIAIFATERICRNVEQGHQLNPQRSSSAPKRQTAHSPS